MDGVVLSEQYGKFVNDVSNLEVVLVSEECVVKRFKINDLVLVYGGGIEL